MVTVTDLTGGVLPGVVVTLQHVATRRAFEGTTTTAGGYLVTLLPVGDYELTFTLSGFQPRICACRDPVGQRPRPD